jgi:hypothetical protein
MEPIPERLPFTLVSHTGSPTGYAETATCIFRALVDAGVEVHYLCTHDDVIYEPPSYDLMVNEYRRIEPEDEPVRVVYSIAPLFHHNAGKYKVGWSMIEVDKICDRWVRACNRMDEVWVPTQMNKEAFVASGVNVRVRVVPLGIDTSQFRPTFLPMVAHDDFKFRFVASGYWQLRKRWDLLLIAFAEEFGEQKDVGLICKTVSEQGPEEVTSQVHSWVGHRIDDQVAVIEGGFPWWEYVGILRACHAFVLPTSGEGWGCPPVQALACGLPVIVTDCQGPGEVLRGEAGEPLPGVRFVAAELAPTGVQHEYYEGSNWWVPDVADLRAAMREVYENYQEWGLAAQRGSEIVRELRSAASAARAVKEELTRIYREEC